MRRSFHESRRIRDDRDEFLDRPPPTAGKHGRVIITLMLMIRVFRTHLLKGFETKNTIYQLLQTFLKY